MLAYSHPIVTREAFLAEMQAHADADQIVQGRYWKDGRGCAVGCALHSINRLLVDGNVPCDDHEMLAEILNIPPQLAYLEDTIFEGLPLSLARQWPMRFASAIQQDADLNNVWPQFAVWLMREISLPAAKDHLACETAIERVARGYETRWQLDTADAAAAAAAAADAAHAAYAAGDATYDARAANAAYAAGDAAHAAAAADAAADAAANAARAARAAADAASAANNASAAIAADAAHAAAHAVANNAYIAVAASAAYAVNAAVSASNAADAAARAADAAANAVRAAAKAAAAADAARAAAYTKMADKLIELIAAAPIGEAK
jgi:hypothetical protein